MLLTRKCRPWHYNTYKGNRQLEFLSPKGLASKNGMVAKNIIRNQDTLSSETL